jgi:hypothetical protein
MSKAFNTEPTAVPTSTRKPRAKRTPKIGLDTAPAAVVVLGNGAETPTETQDAPAQDAGVQDTQNANNQTQEKRTMLTIQFRKVNTINQGIYGIEGRPGTILIGPQFFAKVEGETQWPETLDLDIELPAAEAAEPKVKLTAEERKALRAAMTPADKLAEQEARLEKQKANLLARKAKLGLVPAEETAEVAEPSI